MTLCINPRCPSPENPNNIQFCQSCGSELLLKLRYRAMRELGGGGFGKTYELSDQGTPKVLKVLINNSPKAVELFQREAEVLSQLNSPGIPRVEPNSYFIFHPNDGQGPLHCLVMEKIEGMNLREYLKQRGRPIDSDSAKRWLTELLLILQQVHDRGILHRDIKPQNIIFKPDGKLALIDFGAVREGTGTEVATAANSGGGTEVATHAAGGTSISSAGYTPAEQINGQAVKPSDFYALGRTFIFLLTAKEPSQIPYDAYNDQLQWRQYAPDVEPKLAELLDQMTATLVRQRPANAQEILQRLESFHKHRSARDQTNSKNESKQGAAIGGGDIEVERNQSSKSTQSKNSAIFWKWFWATLAGYVLGFVAFFIVVFVIAIFWAVSTGAVSGTDAEFQAILDKVVQTRWSSALAWGVFGLVLGTAQWFVLRRQMPKASDWINATAFGFVWYGFLMAASKYMSISSTAPKDPLLEIGIALCGGGLIGLAQWLHYLRKYISGSAWWVLLGITSSVISSVMGIASPTLGIVFALVIDPILTGWGMNRLFKQYLKNS